MRSAALFMFVLSLVWVSPAAVQSIAHRGDSLFAPENTIAAFRSALEKADFVELDAQVAADGTLVVMHDTTVDRTTDGTGLISSLTIGQLRALDAGSWFSPGFSGEHVPTVEEAITNIVTAATVLLERKTGSASAYVQELQRLQVSTNVVIQAFDWTFLAAVHGADPSIRLGALGSGAFTTATVKSVLNAGASLVAWEKSGVTVEMLQLAREAGLQVFVWTVDGPEIAKFIELGVDGIISNDPGMVRQYQAPAAANPGDLSKDLKLYWRLDDGLTNSMAANVTDSMGASHSVLSRLDGLSHWNPRSNSLFGSSVQIDGANSYIYLPRNAVTDIGTNALSISVWVRLRDLPSRLTSSYGAILDSTNDCYVLYLDKANRELRFKVTDKSGHAARPGIPEALLATNRWTHIAATYSGNAGPVSGQAVIYLNGKPVDVHTGQDGSSPVGLSGFVKAPNHAAIGREGPAGANYFAGQVDDFAIWSRSLNPVEVQAIYAGGANGLSLSALLRKPTNQLRIIDSRFRPDPPMIDLDFRTEGGWKSFQLLHSTRPSGPFLRVPDLAPTLLGNGQYRFSCPVTNMAAGFFAVEAE